MPIPANQQTVVQIQHTGLVSAAGSNNRQVNQLYYFQRPVSSVAINKASVGAAFEGVVVPPLLLCLNHRFSETFLNVRCLNDANDLYLSTPETGVGAVTGDSMPTFNAAYMLIRTALRGKMYRGSKHYFPLSESDTTSGSDDILNAAALARWATFLTAWLGGFTDGGGNVWTPVLLQKTSSQTRTNPTVVNVTPIAQMIPRKSIGRMKRREVSSVY